MNNFIIKYGINYIDSIDISEEILKKYVKQNVLHIDTFLNFNNLKVDPYPTKKKKIIIIYNKYIKYFEEKRNQHIIIDFNDNYNNFNIKYGINLDNSIDITYEILNKNLLEDKNILHILKNTNLNNFKYDPYPSIVKKLFINYNNIRLEYDEYLDDDIIINFLNKDNTNKTFGFILLRHVNSFETNEYWIYSYNCIRKIYPENLIIIIDDNSDYKFIKNIDLYKTSIIQSEYIKRGELLPYYYYSKNKFFDKAFIIHDSVFINEYIDISYIHTYKIIWDFDSRIYIRELEKNIKNIINVFQNKKLNNFYQNKKWKGCFGSMSIITYDFLNNINLKYDLSLLLKSILNRKDRECFERVLGCLLHSELKIESLYGCIFNYLPWGIKMKDINKYNHLPIIKIWTGR